MIADIEKALTGELAAAAAAGKIAYGYRTLESYPENFDAYLKDKGELRCPAAWAVFLGMPEGDDHGDGTGWNGRASFALVVASQNLRGETETRHGDATTPGSYTLAIDAAQVIHGSDLGLDLVRPMELKAMMPLTRPDEGRRQLYGMMALEFHCTVPLGEMPGGGNIADFRTFHADWDVPPHGNVTPPLPAIDPDAEDLVELPQ